MIRSTWQSIQKNMTWRAVLVAWLVAGTVFLITNLLLTPIVFDVDSGLLFRYFASIVLGSDVLVENAPFTVVTGIAVHYALSGLFTVLVTIVVHRWGLWVGLIGGGLIGVAIYGINLYLFTRLLNWFEWFSALESNILLLSHILFGAVAGGIYELFDHYDEPLVAEVQHERT